MTYSKLLLKIKKIILNINILIRLVLSKEITLKNTNSNQDVKEMLTIKFNYVLRQNKNTWKLFQRINKIWTFELQ